MGHTTLTLGSLFDGSGGFPLGGLLAGITPVWASEIEPFAIRVTTKRFPNMKHYGDISQMDGGKIEPVDIITFGSPCTNLSIAGRREGIQGPQSSLFFQAIRIIKEMRCATNGRYPRWICWENVVGAYSSNRGFDFKKVLEEIIGIVEPGTEVPMPEKNRWPCADCYMGDGWSVAYRTFDAQYWGVPQRRRRVYLVGDFGGQRAGQVLFESEGLSGYSAQGFRAWQRAAGGAAAGIGAAGIGFDCYNGTLTYDVAHTLVAMGSGSGDRMPMVFEPAIVLNDQGGTRMDVSEDVSGTLRAQMDGHPPCVLALENHPMDGRIKVDGSGSVQTLTSRMGTGGMNVPLLLKIRSGCEGGGKGALIQEDVSATLSCNNDQTLFEPKCYGICSKHSFSMQSDNPHSGFYEASTSRTLDQGGGNPTCNQGGIAVVEGPTYAVTTGSYTQVSEEQAPTLMARDFKDPAAVNRGYSVRRLTPTECAALQGFPRWWCADLGTESPTEDEIVFWAEVWETHRKIMGTSTKPKSQNQIIKWLQHPHSDAAEYRLWGNGVALPNVFFVLAGIVWAAQIDSG